MTAFLSHAPFDREQIEAKGAGAVVFVDEMLPELGEKAHALGLFEQEARSAAGWLAMREDLDARRHLSLAARAGVLACALAMHPPEEVTVAFDDAHVVSTNERDPWSGPHARTWTQAMWAALAVGDRVAQLWLAAVPAGALANAAVTVAPHVQATNELLRSIALRDGRHGAALVAALERLRAGDEDAEALRHHTEAFDAPSLVAFAALASDEPRRFEEALVEVLARHRQAHASGSPFAVTPLLSLPALALRRLAGEIGWAPRVESAYMPAFLWRRRRLADALGCASCALPRPVGASSCAFCGEASGRDAPLEIDLANHRSWSAKRCTACEHALHVLAVRCPSCRVRQRS